MTRLRQETLIELGKRDLISLCAGSPQDLTCISGEIWITFDGRQEDIILRPGEHIELGGQPGIVLSALQESRINISSTVGCRLDRQQSISAAVRRLRWRFPELSNLPSTRLR